MTIIPLGAARCIDCKAPVAIVRRTVEVPCKACPYCDDEHAADLTDMYLHTHAIPDCVWTTVDADGTRHECAA